MQGPMGSLDNELRKELEQALVDEIAKNLGDTIDQMGTSNIEDEDLGKLIEEGFSEIEKELAASSTTSTSTATTTTESTTTSRRVTASTPTRRTATTAVDEMMEESPFDRTLPPIHRVPTTKTTPRPRPTTTIPPTTTPFRTTATTRKSSVEWRTTTTSPRAISTTRPVTTAPTTKTTPWWMFTTPSTTATSRPTVRTTRPTTESCPTPNDPSDTNRTDVLFLLDSSNSFNEHKFMHAIQLILDTVSQFRNIGPNGTQVSLVQYNSEPYLEFSLRKHNCKQFLIDDIADTDYMQGGSMLGKAVEKVSRFAFTKNRGDRPDAENVLVILTDGQSDDRIQEPVEVAKKHNLTVLVIATLEANPQYLIDLAGNMNNVFQLHTDIKNTLPHKLAQRINSIQAGMCAHLL
ncbi:von Willebrand factor type A domain protein [Teladorsagia circumcincta]|uniref:von Willebrand factor type A domain protein n=1 Tax=Teladorsagia circumcincta TaxID=45464 RepID=A0A2G9U6P3_TELCI|nr:von Willebrand factor type A domain protein [Teladorsagia circumcincta]